MKRLSKKIMNMGVIGAAVIAGCSACTDTMDDHYGASENLPKATLWEQLKAQEDLTDFVKVLEKVHYYNSETRRSNMTYKDVLMQNNKLTVWAPVNGTFNADSLLAAIETDEYDVDHRFVRNHINVFSRNVTGAALDSVTMLNAKLNILDNTTKTFKGVAIKEANIAASNGMLHKLVDDVPFLNNVYEYMSVNPNLSDLRAYFALGDTTYFDEDLSIKGPIVDGEVTIVDTFWISESRLFYSSFDHNGNTWFGVNANLKNEDSTWVMVMPTNKGWKQAMDKTLPYFKYMAKPYANKNDKNKDPLKINPDSMQNIMAQQNIVNRLVFSTNRQPGYTFEDFGNTDSLITTTGVIIEKPYCNQIFDGQKPKRLSNGYVYEVDNYLYNMGDENEVEGENGFYLYRDGMKQTSGTFVSTVTKANRNPNIKGSLGGNAYIYTSPKASELDPTNISFKLPNILSAKYDIYAVIVPANIQDTTVKVATPIKFNAMVSCYQESGSEKQTKSKESFISDPKKIDTICVFKDFAFPVAYTNVADAYPTLTLTVTASRKELSDGKYLNSIYLDKIILKLKEE